MESHGFGLPQSWLLGCKSESGSSLLLSFSLSLFCCSAFQVEENKHFTYVIFVVKKQVNLYKGKMLLRNEKMGTAVTILGK